jgi:hypothetical protein
MKVLFLLLSIVLWAQFFKRYLNLGLVHSIGMWITLFFSVGLLVFLYDINLFLSIDFRFFYYEILIVDVVMLGLRFRSLNGLSNFKFYNIEIGNELILFAIILFIGTQYVFFDASRWGWGDGFSIWNLHAKFLIQDNYSWENIFSPSIAWTHSDYPLFLPSLIAIFWKAHGKIDPIIPMIICYLQYIAFLIVFYSATKKVKNKWVPVLFILLFTLDVHSISIVKSQYADSLLALAYLTSFFLFINGESGSKTHSVLLGFFASLPIWIKNEGVFFFLVSIVFIALMYHKNLKKFFLFVLGATPVVLLWLYFKIVYAPENDVVSGAAQNFILRLLDISRYFIILKWLFYILLREFPLLLIAFLLVIYNSRFLISWKFSFVCCVFSCYFMAYLLTPHNLSWHLSTSMSRLIYHLYPTILYFGIFLIDDLYTEPKQS